MSRLFSDSYVLDKLTNSVLREHPEKVADLVLVSSTWRNGLAKQYNRCRHIVAFTRLRDKIEREKQSLQDKTQLQIPVNQSRFDEMTVQDMQAMLCQKTLWENSEPLIMSLATNGNYYAQLLLICLHAPTQQAQAIKKICHNKPASAYFDYALFGSVSDKLCYLVVAQRQEVIHRQLTLLHAAREQHQLGKLLDALTAAGISLPQSPLVQGRQRVRSLPY